eukprot:TRINITY_DN7858_c1_g1_i6.p1 TRINITY_DN7858_c1_g1~~TRINITY_DN7858_c1_g1_i6.p1  ORF type:complete len:453 (-),score=55.62 TRINITY_DN7858_c1_g1_i6:22-1380(-)
MLIKSATTLRNFTVLATFWLALSLARADLTVTASMGTIDCDIQPAGSVGGTPLYDIDITYTGTDISAAAEIKIVSDGTDAIRDITIETRTNPLYGGTTIATLLIDGDVMGGKITGVRSIDWIAPSGGRLPARFQVNIDLSDTASPFGLIGSDTAKEYTLEAHAFTSVRGSDCNANLTVIQDTLTTDGLADIDLDGDMTGDVSCTYLRKLWVNGDLGTDSNPVDVEVLDRLENFFADSAYADFDVAGDLNLFQIYGSTGPGGTTADGVFKGTLTCDTALALLSTTVPVIRIWGDLHADSTITIDDELSAGHAVRIGGSLEGDIDFNQSDGLKGRVTVNWLDSGGEWNGDVIVGTQTLMPVDGDYPETGLGGGAVGEAPYGLHRQACDPPYVGSTWHTFTPNVPCDPAGKEPLTIDLVHYGAISNLVRRRDRLTRLSTLGRGRGHPHRVEKKEK